jgi:hypothetical protein
MIAPITHTPVAFAMDPIPEEVVSRFSNRAAVIVVANRRINAAEADIRNFDISELDFECCFMK